MSRWIDAFLQGKRGALLLVLALIVGATLRLVWGDDIEYKGDEAYTYHLTQHAGDSEPFPWLGMPSSAGILNPGLSIWVFIGLGKLFPIAAPPDLARAVQLCSILALFLYLPFIHRLIPAQEREPWEWGVALMALNPLAVLLHRKIWPPSLFPLLTLAFLAGWWRRERFWGAVVFGFVGALLGQVHMPGFFLAAGFVLWALLFDRKNVRWRGWFLGSILGTLPMIPWLYYLLLDPQRAEPIRGTDWDDSLRLIFYVRWITQSFGLTLAPTLGSDFADFLRGPIIVGTPTYGLLAVHIALVLLLIAVALLGSRGLWRRRAQWLDLLAGRCSPTAFTIAAAFWGYGLLFTLSLRPYRWYYNLCAMPLMFIGLAQWILNLKDSRDQPLAARRALLLAVCLLQAAISVGLLVYVHNKPTGIRGDYRVPYRGQ